METCFGTQKFWLNPNILVCSSKHLRFAKIILITPCKLFGLSACSITREVMHESPKTSESLNVQNALDKHNHNRQCLGFKKSWYFAEMTQK